MFHHKNSIKIDFFFSPNKSIGDFCRECYFWSKLEDAREYYLLIANNLVVWKVNLTWSTNKHWSRENGGERNCYTENITCKREHALFLCCLSGSPLWCPLLRVILLIFQGTASGWWRGGAGDPFLLRLSLLGLIGVYPPPSSHPFPWCPGEVCELPRFLPGHPQSCRWFLSDGLERIRPFPSPALLEMVPAEAAMIACPLNHYYHS